MSDIPQTYEDVLVTGWEEVYRKSQLSLLIMLALKDGPKHVSQIKQFIVDASDGIQTTDEQSLYRTLRRFYTTEVVAYQEIPGGGSGPKKLYSLTDTGNNVLQIFLRRNIINFLYKPRIRKLIER